MDTLESQHELAFQEQRPLVQRRLLREVNERIFEVAQGWGLDDVPTSFHCECGCAGCAELVPLTETEYAQVRASKHVFIVAPEHGAMARGRVVGEIARRAVLVESELEQDAPF